MLEKTSKRTTGKDRHMRQRGRPSKASRVTAVTGELPGDRPQPPSELSPPERVEWNAIAARMPADWFTRETQPLLAELCVIIVLSRDITHQIHNFDRGLLKYEKMYNKWLAMLRLKLQLQSQMANLSSKLRLTHRSRYDAKTAFNNVERATKQIKPWDLDGEDDKRLDREAVPGPGGSAAWTAGEAGELAEAGADKNLRQPGDHAQGDPELREEEREDEPRGVSAAGASGRPKANSQFAFVFDGAKS